MATNDGLIFATFRPLTGRPAEPGNSHWVNRESAGAGIPRLQPPNRFDNIVRRPGKRKADLGIAPTGIEIDTRRCRYAGFVKHTSTECLTVIGEAGHICVDVERTIRRRQPIKP